MYCSMNAFKPVALLELLLPLVLFFLYPFYQNTLQTVHAIPDGQQVSDLSIESDELGIDEGDVVR
jgi:hypothetical protein